MALACVNVCGCHVVQALVVTLMVIVPDEGSDVCLKITGQEVVFEQDAVLQRLMPSLNLALCLWMIGRAACVRHAFVFKVFGQITGDVAWSVVGQQARTMHHIRLIQPCRFQSLVQRILNV